MKLNDVQRGFIIRAWACHMRLYEIVNAFEEEFGHSIDKRQVYDYRPDRPDRPLAPKWHEIFRIERARYLAEIESIPLANAATRLRLLNDMAFRAHEKNDFSLTAELIEQAAKEVGGAFTNKRELGGTLTVDSVSPDEARATLLAAIEEAALTRAQRPGE